MIYERMPHGFSPRLEIVSCFVEHGGEILLLHRHSHKSQGNRWGVPAGKIDPGEGIEQALLREIREETGLSLSKQDLLYFRKVFVSHEEEGYDIIYHMFHTRLPERKDVTIRPEEHKRFIWATPKDALRMHLVEDLGACIKLFYRID
jgi:8-oxo-dGTP pyrophosphatase MutT (NUDIX family)